MSITWHIERRPIRDLREHPGNPRLLTKKGLADLRKSVNKFGLAEPLVIQPDGKLIGGHARLKTLEAVGAGEADCMVPDRELTTDEVRELNIRLNRNVAGEWDFDKLANEFDIGELKEWGFEEWELGGKKRGTDADVDTISPATPPDADAIVQRVGDRMVGLAYSGGLDSSMALLRLVGALGPSRIVAALVDNGYELPLMRLHVSDVCRKLGVQLHVLPTRVDFIDMLGEKGWPFHGFPWCQHDVLYSTTTEYWKSIGDATTLVIASGKQFGQTKGNAGVTQDTLHGFDVVYPAYNATREESTTELLSAGVPIWPGYAAGFPRTACWLCPGGKPEFKGALRRCYPGLFSELCYLQRRYGVSSWAPGPKKDNAWSAEDMADEAERRWASGKAKYPRPITSRVERGEYPGEILPPVSEP